MKELFLKIGDKIGVDVSDHQYYCTYYWAVLSKLLVIIFVFALLLWMYFVLLKILLTVLKQKFVDSYVVSVTDGEVVIVAISVAALIGLVFLVSENFPKLLKKYCEPIPVKESNDKC